MVREEPLECIFFKSHKVLGIVDGLYQEHVELHGVSYYTIGALVIYPSLLSYIPLSIVMHIPLPFFDYPPPLHYHWSISNFIPQRREK